MHRRHPVRAGATGLALALAVAAAFAHGSGAPVLAAEMPMREVGAGSLYWFGLHVYDARLAAAGERFDPEQPFALILRYARDFKGQRIAQASIDEIRRLGYGTAGEQERWLEAMRELFPDVRRGDELAGVALPGRGARFYLNGRPIGAIGDAAFARAFFAIWLDPRTRSRELRAQLLGEAQCAGGPSGAAAARC